MNDFETLSALLRKRSGLVLAPDKTYLIESRLLPVARRWKMPDLHALTETLRGLPPADLVREIVEAMTTNESFFFRDGKPFDLFRTVILPRLLKSREATKSLRIWSAACSSGQEPYSLAMILAEERARLANWRVEIVATDLSTEILSRAEAGTYSQFEVQRGLPLQLLDKHFDRQGDRWCIKPELRRNIRFRTFNLLDDPVALGRFDVVFCRNVLIYFDQPTKKLVLERIARNLASDGVMFLGGAETVLGVTDRFRSLPERHGAYSLSEPARPVAQAV